MNAKLMANHHAINERFFLHKSAVMSLLPQIYEDELSFRGEGWALRESAVEPGGQSYTAHAA
jgi:hypothetical protein